METVKILRVKTRAVNGMISIDVPEHWNGRELEIIIMIDESNSLEKNEETEKPV